MTGHGHGHLAGADATEDRAAAAGLRPVRVRPDDLITAGHDEPRYCGWRLFVDEGGNPGDVDDLDAYRLCVLPRGHPESRPHEWSATLRRDRPRAVDDGPLDVTGNRYRAYTVGEGSRLVVDVEERRPAGLGVMLDPDASWALALQALEVAATGVPAAGQLLALRRIIESDDPEKAAAVAVWGVPLPQLARILADRLEAEADG